MSSDPGVHLHSEKSQIFIGGACWGQPTHFQPKTDYSFVQPRLAKGSSVTNRAQAADVILAIINTNSPRLGKSCGWGWWSQTIPHSGIFNYVYGVLKAKRAEKMTAKTDPRSETENSVFLKSFFYLRVTPTIRLQDSCASNNTWVGISVLWCQPSECGVEELLALFKGKCSS